MNVFYVRETLAAVLLLTTAALAVFFVMRGCA